jgi:hypothetical protein
MGGVSFGVKCHLKEIGLHHGQPARRIVFEPEAKIVDKLLGDPLKTRLGQVKLPSYIVQYTALSGGDGLQRVWKILHMGALPI